MGYLAMIPPEIIVGLIALATICIGGSAKLITAMVDRRVIKLKLEADDEKISVERDRKEREEKLEDERKDRELKRQMDMESMKQATAKALAEAEEAKAINQNLMHLEAAVLEMMKSNAAEGHANRNVLSNQQQSIGDMIDSVDDLGKTLTENTNIVRLNTGKVDAVTAAVDRLYDKFVREFPVENTMLTIFDAFKKTMLEAIENISVQDQEKPAA